MGVIKIQISKLEKGEWPMARETLMKLEAAPKRAERADYFEFDRFACKKNGRSVSLRSILISNFEF
jgi:hypothetical protein